MLLGKRPRHPMRRTTSMTEFTFDLSHPEAQKQAPETSTANGLDPRSMSMVSPRNHRKNAADFLETAPFLRACGLCKRGLGPGRDIYMYRGDAAFCSLECRQRQMNQDERKEKCSSTSMPKEASSTTGTKTQSNGERVATA